MIYELPEAEARELLASKSYGHLGCVVDDEPYVVPLNYVHADDRLYSHSLPGRKIDSMRSTRAVCLQVEEVVSEYHWRSVQAFCRFEEILDVDERERIAALLFERFPRLTPADSVRRHGHLGAPTILFALVPRRIVGIAEG